MSGPALPRKTMRVLHVYKYFRPDFSGEGIFLERLAPVFVAQRPDVRHEVLVVTTYPSATKLPPEGLDAVHYIARSKSGASQLDIVRWLVRHGPAYDVIHFHTHVDRTFLASAWLKLIGRRLVLSATLDDSVPGLLLTYRSGNRGLIRRLFGLIDRFVAISPKLQAENDATLPAGRSALVPIGIPVPARDPAARAKQRRALGIPAQVTMLVSVGGICERKDQALLVEQLAILAPAHPDLLLVLVGPPLERDYQARLESFIATHQLGRQVVFAGYSERPWDYYAAADLMVFASREEGFGTVMIEAMANGLPIVARRLPGVNDVFIRQGENGYLFDTPDEYSARVAALAADPAQRTALGQQGRNLVSEQFNIIHVATQYLDLYDSPPTTRP